MKRLKFISPVILLAFIVLFSCNNDDDGVVVVPPHERDDEAIVAQDQIEEFLTTHFYNYEEFETPPAEFNYQIVYDTIAGVNLDKIALINQVDYKMVTDIRDENVTYKLYYLNVNQGEGDDVEFTDIVTVAYKGMLLEELALFDSSVNPVAFDLTQIVDGLQSTLIEFNGSTGYVENGDGTITFSDYGIGAAFIPSGLAYFNTPPTGAPIPYYSQLIFNFHVYKSKKSDQDNDGILSYLEDLDGDGFEGNDDTDENGIPNFADGDDDGDGRLTKNEIETNEYTFAEGEEEPTLAEGEIEMDRETDDETGVTTVYTVIFTDVNEDGVADYLDDQI